AAGVKPGERLRIVVDRPFAPEAEELAVAARALGAEARVACFPSERPMLEATLELMETAAWAHVSIGLLRHSYVEEIPARHAMIEVLLGHGGRALGSPDIDHEMLRGELSQPIPAISTRARGV